MGKNRFADLNGQSLEEQRDLATEAHHSVGFFLEFFSFFAPAGLPLLCLIPCQPFFPKPLSELPRSEWLRLFEVLEAHGLIIRTTSELCLLECVQEGVRADLDGERAKQLIYSGVQFVASLTQIPAFKRMDIVNRVSWHTVVLARWAAQTGQKKLLAPLLELLDRQGRLLIGVWPDRAIISHRQAVALCRVLQGDEHPSVAIRINNLAEAWHRLGEHERADGFFQQALALAEKALGGEHQLVANLLGNLGMLRRDQGKIEEATGFFQRALAIMEQKHGLENPLVNLCVNGLGRIIRSRDGAVEAAQFLGISLAKSNKVSREKSHPHVALIYNNLAVLQIEIGEGDLARENLLVSLEVAKQSLPETHPLFGQISGNLMLLESPPE
ncbi:MAG: tetratricopeptide repeat protein [Magnetococcales bacterium]|nr:tetratricopeptide repeat protein [Magnetococcales bacterium]